MKTVGMIGGIGPESTVEYYRSIIATYHEQKRDGDYPSIIINSIDLKKMLDLIEANELAKLTEYLVGEVQKLARAGADCGLLAANTPHIVFDEIRRGSPLPLVSIVEATCQAAKALGLKRLGLFGTRFTMQGGFYPDVFSKEGIAEHSRSIERAGGYSGVDSRRDGTALNFAGCHGPRHSISRYDSDSCKRCGRTVIVVDGRPNPPHHLNTI